MATITTGVPRARPVSPLRSDPKQGPPCPACSAIMYQTSGMKFQCRACSYIISCCGD